jgi:hypothetical protein
MAREMIVLSRYKSMFRGEPAGTDLTMKKVRNIRRIVTK